METTEEFIKWHSKFSPNFQPWDIENWLKWVDKTHENIRGILGGIKKEVVVELEKEKTQVDYYTAENYYYNLARLIPGYFNTYQDTRCTTFQQSTILFNGKKIKLTKHIQGYLDRNNIAEETKRCVSAYLVELGKLFSVAESTGPITINVLISTDPKDFLYIGHQSCDRSSCFRQSGQNRDKKYTLATQPDSFVLFAYTDKPAESKAKYRFIGYLLGDIWNFCSPYPSCYNDIKFSYKEFLNKIVNQLIGKDLCCTENRANLEGGGLYGHTPSFSFGLGHKWPQKLSLVASKSYPLVYNKECYSADMCGRLTPAKPWEQI